MKKKKKNNISFTNGIAKLKLINHSSNKSSLLHIYKLTKNCHGQTISSSEADLSIYLSICLSVCLSVCLFVCLHVCLSVYFSISSLYVFQPMLKSTFEKAEPVKQR